MKFLNDISTVNLPKKKYLDKHFKGIKKMDLKIRKHAQKDEEIYGSLHMGKRDSARKLEQQLKM